MEQTDHCQHDCHNTPGSYICSCNIGFQILDSDGRTCDGERNTIDKPNYTLLHMLYQILTSVVMVPTTVNKYATTRMEPTPVSAMTVMNLTVTASHAQVEKPV